MSHGRLGSKLRFRAHLLFGQTSLFIKAYNSVTHTLLSRPSTQTHFYTLQHLAEMRSLSAITCILLLAFAALSSGAEVKEPSTSSSISGLIPDNNEYHRLCDKGKPAALDNAKPRACFTTKLHVAKNLHDPQPAELHGFIDSSGKSKFFSSLMRL